jgi:ribonuclease R
MRRGRPGAGKSALPDKADVLAFLAEHPDRGNKRELTRAFGIKGDARAPFKALLREMEREGLLARSRKTVRRAAELPSVTVVDIPTDADPDNLIAYPAKWDEEDGERPKIRIETPKRARVVPGPGNRILARIERGDGEVPDYVGRAMKIIDRPRRAIIGIVRSSREGARLVPVERKGRELSIAPGDMGEAEDGDLVEVEIITTGRAMRQRARVLSVIGNPHSEKAISLIAIHNLEIPYRFPGDVLAEAEAAEPVDLKGREDWREMPILTIDPADAKDHDDAVYAEPDTDKANKGGFIVYIAIADVAHYVRPGSDLDREAYLRGNSVYFPDRVVPMLPERISNDLCSLKEGENRPAMALRMVIDKSGAKKSHSFHRVVIRSAAKLSYQQAQAAIDGHPDDQTGPLLEPVLKPLWAAYGAMHKARLEREPLDLDLPERRVILNDKGLVEDIVVPPRLDAHKLIEEMMIMANVCAAETLEAHDVPLLYRVHDAPSIQKLEGLRETLKSLELNLAKGMTLKPAHFNRILARADSTDNPHLVNELVLRAQAQAEYTHQNYGHFGLNLRRYAHFTSPIRRYADLIVHRALIQALKLGPDGLTEGEVSKLPGIGEHISMTERRAMAAERETVDRLMAHFLVDRIGDTFKGRIAGVTRSGLFVKLDVTGADGFIPASTLGTDYYRYVETEMALIGERSGERFRMGDRVEVRLLEAAPMAGALRFELLSEGERVTPLVGGGRRKASGKARPGGKSSARGKSRSGGPNKPRKKARRP